MALSWCIILGMGRPSTYTPEIAAAICEQLAAGNSLRRICEAEGMPPAPTVRLWVIDDREGFAAQYTRARDAALDSMADDVMDIADDSRNDWMDRETKLGNIRVVDREALERSRLRFDARRWYLSKLAPKRYGDRIENRLADADGNALKITVTGIQPNEKNT